MWHVRCCTLNLLAQVDEEERVTLIDFPQMVSTAHPNAAELYQRDVDCIARFFAKKLGYLPQHDAEAAQEAPPFEVRCAQAVGAPLAVACRQLPSLCPACMSLVHQYRGWHAVGCGGAMTARRVWCCGGAGHCGARGSGRSAGCGAVCLRLQAPACSRAGAMGRRGAEHRQRL